MDVDANDRLVHRYREMAEQTRTAGVVGEVGHFGGCFALPGPSGTMLASSIDGVGTKVMVARLAKRLDKIGEDLVNHCVNDVLAVGAEPQFFLDYLAANALTEDQKAEIVGGVATACQQSGIALLGGETADMPNLYPKGEFDLAGAIVGILPAGGSLSRTPVMSGDSLIGLPSSGLHTNGYTLAREVLGLRPSPFKWLERYRARRLREIDDNLGESLADALLRPHVAYWQPLRKHMPRIKALAHITGGGIAGNLERVLPPAAGAELHARVWAVPPIFRLIQRRGRISASEMFRVFNMGLGMIAVVPADDAEALAREIPDAARVGEVVDAGGRAGIERVRITGIGDPADA